MFTLFFSPGSCSRASHIVLEESGLPYKAHRVNFAEGEQRSEAFLKINPKGRVPAAGHRKRRADGDARHSRLYRPDGA